MTLTLKERNRRRASRIVAALTFFVAAGFCALVLQNHPDEILGFAHVGTVFSEGIPKDEGGTVGYDGQFVYFIARDGVDAVPLIDGPSFRYQRIVYPALGRLLALGQADLVPYALVLINIAALTFGAGMLAYLLGGWGVSPYYALIYALWPGNLFALRFDLTELLCYAFALAALWTYQRAEYRRTVLLLILSALTKEIGLVMAGGLALHAALGRWRWRWAILLAGAPIVAYGTWWQMLHLWLGDSPAQYPAAKFAPYPLQGLISVLTTEYTLQGAAKVVHFILLVAFIGLPAVIFLALALRKAWALRGEFHAPSDESAREDWLPLALIFPALAFIAMMPGVSWQDPAAAYRVGLPLFITGLIFIAGCYPRAMRWLVFYWSPACLIVLMIPALFTG